MSCKGCTCGASSKSSAGDKVAGCGSNGCSSGGCNRMNTFDWLSALDIEDPNLFDTVEISFKNGTRKEFFKNPSHARAMTGDMVLVETDGGGYDLGRISLSGELVRAQMKKRGFKEKTVLQNVIRKANERDLERLQEARESEKATMIQARVIARTLGLDMKIGDVEYQGDKRKATFFYIADGRVDFRELIREYAREFKVKIEMRQIGARQESARVGGLGPCGRELCCSTWLTDFKSVSTVAARYQNLAINQSKLSGQCGRLKCCLNYELDTYIDALEHFPSHADRIYTEEGGAVLMKTDIFKGLMYYCYEKDHGRGKFYPLEIEQVKEILEANKNGMRPQDLSSVQVVEEEEIEVGFDGDLTGVVELPSEKRKKKKSKRKKEGEPVKMVKTGSRLTPNKRRDDSDEKLPDIPNPVTNDQRNKKVESGKGENNRSNNKQQQDNRQRPPRAERAERPDGENKNEPRNENRNDNRQRPPRPERTERPDGQNNDAPRNENRNDNRQRPPRAERAERPDGENKNEPRNENRNDNRQRPPRPERTERPDGENKNEPRNENRNDNRQRPPRPERTERPDGQNNDAPRNENRNDNRQRPPRPERTERPDGQNNNTQPPSDNANNNAPRNEQNPNQGNNPNKKKNFKKPFNKNKGGGGNGASDAPKE